jgi:hypothetical protein
LVDRAKKTDMPRNGTNFEQKAQWMRERQSAPSASLSVASTFAERHYTVAEAAAFLNFSSDVVRKIFQDEPGVFVLGQSAAYKRRYTTLRIPASVLERVYRRMTNV